MQGEFHMRKKKSYRGTILLVGVAVLVFITAIKYIPKKIAKNEQLPETQEAVAVQNEKNILLSENSAMKLKEVYNCGHINTQTKETEKNLIGKTQKEIELMYPGWKIDEFSENFISVEVEINKPCENHYIIKLKNNALYVYKQNNAEEYIKKQKISTSMLTKDEIKDLENGITAETEYEVLEILESFAS